MDVRSDDFASLLAALGKAPAPVQQPPQYYQQFAPQQYYAPPIPVQNFIPQPYPQSYAAPPAPVVASKINWVIVILLIAIVVFGLLAWMRSTRMEEPEDRALVREIPPPSTVSSIYEAWPKVEPEPEPEVVANNILAFVEKHAPKDVIDLSGVDLPDEVVFKPSGRISADDSQAVLDYAKKRESLFSE
jgi:hypothetical protein